MLYCICSTNPVLEDSLHISNKKGGEKMNKRLFTLIALCLLASLCLFTLIACSDGTGEPTDAPTDAPTDVPTDLADFLNIHS